MNLIYNKDSFDSIHSWLIQKAVHSLLCLKSLVIISPANMHHYELLIALKGRLIRLFPGTSFAVGSDDIAQ